MSHAPPTARPARRPRRLPGVLIPLLLATLPPGRGGPPALAAQERDEEAGLPARGELWLELHPAFESWHEQFGLASPIAGIEDSEPEPLTADLNGPVAARLFPGLAPLLAVLNGDASALGFDALTVADVSLGSLEVGSVDREIRRIPFVLRYGILDRIAVEIFAPLARTEAETSFAFDSTGATLVDARAIVPDPTGFFSAFDDSLDGLQALVDGGSLDPGQEAAARALLESAGPFGSALSRRVETGALLPHGGTAAGSQIADRYASIQAGFGAFGFTLPDLSFPTVATTADFSRYLGGPPVSGAGLASQTRSWTLGELEVGVRIGLLDTFGRPRTVPRPRGADTTAMPADTAAAPPDTAAVQADTAAAAPDTAAAPPLVPADTLAGAELAWPGGVRVRTTVGVRFRLPLRDADRSPFHPPGDFLGVPIGDGQRDVELALYQDVGFGPKLFLVGVIRRGIQLADELAVRVAPPDRPFATATTLATVERDLGDYWSLRLSPRFRINDVISFGVEYGLWRKESDEYVLVSGGPDAPSADPLEVETEETRHRLGVGVFYRTTDRVRAGVARFPIELHFIFQTAIAGSGGQTPVSSLISAGVRVPIRLF